MTGREKAQVLGQYVRLERQLEQDVQELSQVRGLVRTIQASPAIPCTKGELPPGEELHRAIRRLRVLEQEIEREVQGKVRLRQGIKGAVESLEDGRLREVLELRYLHGWHWEEIAETLCYECRHVTRLHQEALRRLEVDFL